MKVLVGLPVSHHKKECLQQCVDGLNALTYENKKILFMDNSKDDDYKKKIESLGFEVQKGPYAKMPVQRISKSRNKLIDYALENNYDYIFFLDHDVVPPTNAIEQFISRDKKALCGIYFNTVTNPQKQKIIIPGVYKVIPDTKDEEGLPSMRLISQEEVFSEELIKVVSCGGGCLFLHKDIIKKVRFNEELKQCEDRDFCITLFKKNISLYCDSKNLCKHFIKNRAYVWDQGKLKKNLKTQEP
jgi:glycosyltransferase involved in cell wall biosynthesis